MNLIRFILSAIREGVFEANQDTAGDANDEDQAEDDEGRNNNQDEKSVVLVRRTLKDYFRSFTDQN